MEFDDEGNLIVIEKQKEAEPEAKEEPTSETSEETVDAT
jgi:hypothetical protein